MCKKVHASLLILWQKTNCLLEILLILVWFFQNLSVLLSLVARLNPSLPSGFGVAPRLDTYWALVLHYCVSKWQKKLNDHFNILHAAVSYLRISSDHKLHWVASWSWPILRIYQIKIFNHVRVNLLSGQH